MYKRTTTPRPEVDRFWEKVDCIWEGCWIWTGANNYKYGRFWDPEVNRVVYAHRKSWEMENGPIPDGMLVLHTCDVPLCVRPDHLFLGVYADNANDCANKGRTRGPWSAEGYTSPQKGVPSGKKGQPWTAARREAWLLGKEQGKKRA